MKITELVKGRVLNNVRSRHPGEARQSERGETDTVADRTSALASGQDVITISSLARQYQQISRILEEDRAAERNRVEELKRQVAAGTYNVPASVVAQSMIDYTKE